MFRSFDLQSVTVPMSSTYAPIGDVLLREQRHRVHADLDKYFDKDGEIDAGQLMTDWFPEVEADVFISHSHADRVQVNALAAYLREEMGLTAFVDSAVWGYANDLLKAFDSKYCLNSGGATYDYDKRNISTTHVHLMLNMALLSMMDKTEAVFFFNTPNSVSLKGSVEDGDVGTNSPWIFSEISMTRMLRAKEKREHRVLAKSSIVAEALEARDSMPRIHYPLSVGHLITIDQAGFDRWSDKVKKEGAQGEAALDALYQLAGAE